MKFQLSRQAVNDLREIWLYSEENWGIAKADEYLRMVEGQMEVIVGQATAGKELQGLSGYLKQSAGRHIIVFRRDEDGVVIVRVLHERMDPARHL